MKQQRVDDLDDMITATGSAFLGLTVHCARCHDHKFDPISQGDYYAFYGIFDSTRYPFPGSEEHKAPSDFPEGYRPKQMVPNLNRRELTAMGRGQIP